MCTDVIRYSGTCKRNVIVYCVATLIFSWGLWVVAAKSDGVSIHLTLPHQSIRIPLDAMLMVLGSMVPGFVALGICRTRSSADFRGLVAQLLPGNGARLLYLFAIIIPIAVNLVMPFAQAGFGTELIGNLRMVEFGRLFLLNLLLAPLWEEIGWRGYLLPNLLRWMQLGRASLVLGCIWGVWHFVLYLFVLRVSILTFAIGFCSIVAMSITQAMLYCLSGNRLVTPVVFHASWNAAASCVMEITRTYNLGPAILQTLVLWGVAGVAWALLETYLQEE